MSLKINFDDGIEYGVPAGRRPIGGVQIRKDPETGADVFMYKRKPGVYYSAHGTEVSAVMAKRAGFDVETLAKAKEKLQKMADFEASWRTENATSELRTIEDRAGYRLIEHPSVGFYVIHIESGDRMTKGIVAPSLQMGMDWLEQFAGPAPASAETVDGDVQRTNDQGVSRTNRRPGPDATAARNVRAASDPKASVSA